MEIVFAALSGTVLLLVIDQRTCGAILVVHLWACCGVLRKRASVSLTSLSSVSDPAVALVDSSGAGGAEVETAIWTLQILLQVVVETLERMLGACCLYTGSRNDKTAEEINKSGV